MKRYLQLAKETWWLWLGVLAASVFLTVSTSLIFVIMFPICGCIFLYFGFVRYDENGQPK